MDEIITNKQFDDHEARIRQLEVAQMEFKYSLLSLENGVKDVKLMIQEMGKNQNDLLTETSKNQTDLLNKVIDSKLNLETTNNENIWELVFKVCVGIGVVANTVMSIYLK